MYAVKLASLSGYKVVSVASKRNWDLVKSLGADAVFDYNDPNIISLVQKWARDLGAGPLTKGLDTISEHGSQEKCVSILGEGGKLITLRK
jgi:NADPH:quinone reductase-like Zn-dependent oxidoreductase